MDKKYRYGERSICIICSKVFFPRDKGDQQKCCSNACRGKYQTQKAMRACVICSKQFVPARPVYQTCSRECGTVLRLSRRKVDPMVQVRQRLAVFCCSVIARCLRNKTDRTYAMLGYTVEELRAHLEAKFIDGMSWANYGKGVKDWSIDHIRPVSSFPMEAPLSEINALANLQPLWHRENCSKRNKWDGQKIAAT